MGINYDVILASKSLENDETSSGEDQVGFALDSDGNQSLQIKRGEYLEPFKTLYTHALCHGKAPGPRGIHSLRDAPPPRN